MIRLISKQLQSGIYALAVHPDSLNAYGRGLFYDIGGLPLNRLDFDTGADFEFAITYLQWPGPNDVCGQRHIYHRAIAEALHGFQQSGYIPLTESQYLMPDNSVESITDWLLVEDIEIDEDVDFIEDETDDEGVAL